MKSFNIYFSDLNETAQQSLLGFVGIKDATEMNWDMDIVPIAIFNIETDDLTCDTTEYIATDDGWFDYYYCGNCGHKEKIKPDICPDCGRQVI